MYRGRYARVCVEVDLSQPVATKVWFRNQWIRVEFEGIHMICGKCGCYGHLSRNCAVQKPAEGTKATSPAFAAEPSMANPSGGKGNGARKVVNEDTWTEVTKRRPKKNLNLKKQSLQKHKQLAQATPKAKIAHVSIKEGGGPRALTKETSMLGPSFLPGPVSLNLPSPTLTPSKRWVP